MGWKFWRIASLKDCTNPLLHKDPFMEVNSNVMHPLPLRYCFDWRESPCYSMVQLKCMVVQCPEFLFPYFILSWGHTPVTRCCFSPFFFFFFYCPFPWRLQHKTSIGSFNSFFYNCFLICCVSSLECLIDFVCGFTRKFRPLFIGIFYASWAGLYFFVWVSQILLGWLYYFFFSFSQVILD